MPLTLKGQDPYQQELSFVASAVAGRFRETKKDGEKIYMAAEAGTDEVRIYAVNEMNVVSQPFVKQVQVQREKQ